ncbi:MAG: chromosome segregation protein SMC [Planctomycetota bacterium]|nr:chromosome segregation protein SMC [Planctomycetota bacterium]
MFLKRLDAFGFKSFADKVTFDFERGFTCVVGPNGCGKSNVVDAVKWVLGEQSAKSLRGGEMLDVIFNGSANRKPLNFAEVTLTFDNNDAEEAKRLPLAAPEVSVTRRLYRSGDSEYLINKSLCRLRDIRELFWDTGIGTTSYSIIEQGKIGQLLEANSKERRGLFEEAAGIHKYKERKKEALRRLERTEQNMARINDTLGEVERQLRSVTRQAEKARKAKEISDKLRQTKVEILLHDTFTCQASLREVEGSLAGAQEQVASLSAELATAQASTVTEQEAMGRLDGELAEAQLRLGEARAALAGLDAGIEADKRAIEGMAAEAQRAREVAQEAGQRAAALANERERAELDLANDTQALEDRRASERAMSEAYAADQLAYEETARLLEQARRESLDVLGRRAQHQQSLTQAEADLGGIDYRIRKVRAVVEKAEDALRFAQAEAEEIRLRMEHIRKRRESLDIELAGIRMLQARTEDEIERLNARAQELRNQLEKCRSRLTVLEDLNESGEGLSPGARAVMASANAQGSEDPDIHGLAADCLRVNPRHEGAVEAALGANIEAIVCGTFATAAKWFESLREQGLGRAFFLPLDRCGLGRPNELGSHGLRRDALRVMGCLGRAADLVECAGVYRPVAEALLGDVLVFESTAQAQEAYAQDVVGSRWRRVSLQGDLYEPNGAIAGGRFRVDRLGLIGRRNEIERLGVEMDELRQQIEALGERSGFLEKRAQRLVRDDERVTSGLNALAATLTELKGVQAAIAREEARSNEEKKVAGDEIRELEAERLARSERIAGLREEQERLLQQEAAANARSNALAVEMAKRESTVSERRASLEEIKREASTLAARVEGLERHAQSLSAQFAERRDEADRENRRADALKRRREATEAELKEKETEREGVNGRIAEYDGEARRLGEEKENARLRFEDARGRERAVGGDLEKAREQAATIEHQRIELSLRLDTKMDQARNEFQMDAQEELASRGGPPEVPPEALEQARALEEKLQRLGPVNMYALEEQKQLEQRLGFLKSQWDDLESARSSLRDVIARINRRSRKQFEETFEAVRAHFQEIFRKLFGGGKADLILEEGEDILDAGIEITARPPGKEPRSIMQLSGGEKAMTTIALLFAVFRSRPAPFCILDEVDAPLDEANVDRFNMIIREFMDKSQFLVITHNRKTMSYGDVLYGVTMPEPGVSKRIAIKYNEIERHLPMDQIEKQAAEAREKALAAPPAKEAAPESAEAVEAEGQPVGAVAEPAGAGEPVGAETGGESSAEAGAQASDAAGGGGGE